MFGISIYPEKAKLQEILDYMELAAKYNFKRVFANLLRTQSSKAELKKEWSKITSKAKELKMEIIFDVNPEVLKTLEVDVNDLSFFHEMGAAGIRLDGMFHPFQTAAMTHNKHNLKIETNMSTTPMEIETVLSLSANKNNLIGCHNFYPMEFSGLSLDAFIETSLIYKENGIKGAAFVHSLNAKIGPWPVMDGLPTMEIHRNLPIDVQVKHLIMLDLVDDIIISNMFATEAEFKAIANLPSYPVFKIKEAKKLSEIEKKIIYEHDHVYRGDVSDALIRSTYSRVTYRGKPIKPDNLVEFFDFGDICIPNDNYEHYRGELQIIKEPIPNNKERRNFVASIVDEEQFLIDFLAPWSKFKLEKK